MNQQKHVVQTQDVKPDIELNWQQIAAAVFLLNGISTGWWRIGVRLRFATLTTQMTEPGKSPLDLPTGITAVEGLALFATTEGGPMVFDAGNAAQPVPSGTPAPAPKKMRNLRTHGRGTPATAVKG